jgi:hypothetical protein
VVKELGAHRCEIETPDLSKNLRDSKKIDAVLVLAGRNGDALKEVAKAVDQADVQMLPLPLDLGEPAAGKTLVDEALNRFGGIDSLINIRKRCSANRFSIANYSILKSSPTPHLTI